LGTDKKEKIIRVSVYQTENFYLRGSQKPKKFFITDFYCAERKLVVEVDGEIHKSRKYYDEQRDLILQELGVKVLRIKNDELKQMDMVLKKIFKALTQP